LPKLILISTTTFLKTFAIPILKFCELWRYKPYALSQRNKRQLHSAVSLLRMKQCFEKNVVSSPHRWEKIDSCNPTLLGIYLKLCKRLSSSKW